MITFNGVDLSTYFSVQEIRGRGIVQYDTSMIEVTAVDGAYIKGRRRPVRTIEVDVIISADNHEELREKIDVINGILHADEPVPIVFSDEPGRVYYGVVSDTLETTEFVSLHKGTITFLCPDPYKYGDEVIVEFLSDSAVIENPGTAESDPIIELTVKEKATYAKVATENEQYNMIGFPVSEEGAEEIVDYRTSVLYEDGSTIDEWQWANQDMVDAHLVDIDGGITFDGAGIRADGYGTGDKVHGPAVFKELTNSIQDFEIESTFDIISRDPIENWRMEIYFHDENLNNLGKIGVKDNRIDIRRRAPLGRYGHYRGSGRTDGYVLGDQSESNDNAREVTLMYLRVRREGQRYSFYIGEWRDHKHINVWEGTAVDIDNQFQGSLRYITLFIGKYQDRPNPERLRINSVEVFELQTVSEDQTPYILYPGDVVIFDHTTDEILINGEDAMRFKNLGGSFFSLLRGHNTLTVMPYDTFDVQLRFRPRYR